MPTDDSGENLTKAAFADYEHGWNHRHREYAYYKRTLSHAALGFVAAGLVALFFGFTVLTVALIVLGFFFAQGTFHYDLMEDMMLEHLHLARLIKQLTNPAALRS